MGFGLRSNMRNMRNNHTMRDFGLTSTRICVLPAAWSFAGGCWGILLALVTLGLASHPLWAQGNYEIQVYGAETVPPKNLMFEVHSNFTVDGSRAVAGSKYGSDGTYPTRHAQHETIEMTTGVTRWSEVGFYIFTSASEQTGLQWVGDHIRPRVRAPDSWKWPVGVSLSAEVGYQRARFSPDTWTLELRPIIDKQTGRWYYAFNPTLDKSFHGPGASQGMNFSPNVKVSYDFTKKVTGGVEYYAAYGVPGNFDPIHEQQQQIFPTLDLNLSPKWEVNLGVGIGPTAATDRWIVKAIIGRRFTFGRPDPEAAKTTETKPKS